MEKEYWLVVTEWDTSDLLLAKYGGGPKDGPLVAETYLNKPRTKENATMNARGSRDYGRTWIAKLTDFEEVK